MARARLSSYARWLTTPMLVCVAACSVVELADNGVGDEPAGSGSDSSGSDGSDDGATTPPTGALPSPLHGVTAADVSNLAALADALHGFSNMPTVRIVFDEGQPPSAYAQAVPTVHGVAHVLGEILDSEYVSQITPAAYVARTQSYLAAFPSTVDVWEIGNEINGEWLGATSDVVAKMTGAFDAVEAAGKPTALTLYGCSDAGASYDMITWVRANVPPRMRTGLEYVLVSYYEGDCGEQRTDWQAAFAELRELFPNAGLGFGEIGHVNSNGDGLTTVDPVGAAAYAAKYYGMQINVPGYVGGYFWWYFSEDAVPKTKSFWSVLNSLMN